MSEQLLAKQAFSIPFGIYLHWPFCKSKCPYCNFYKEVRKDIPQEEIINGYVKDLEYYHKLTANKTVSSIFFGGGTPSLIEPKYIEKIIDRVHRLWTTTDEVEISLEANPNSDRPGMFADLYQAGINRLSLGVQALNDKDLKFLGRTHNLKQAVQSIDEVLHCFNNHSMDLIYARPAQTADSWLKELTQAATFGFKHISMYQLTIEDGTFFARKGITALEEEAAAAMYDLTNVYLNSHGYPQYEVSNYGLPCRHNLLYWQGGDYLGIGKSAHGRITTGAKMYASLHPCQLEPLTAEERAEELVIMGLRLIEGINKRRFEQICGLSFDDFINQNNLQDLTAGGFLEDSAETLRATPNGFKVLNKLIEELCI